MGDNLGICIVDEWDSWRAVAGAKRSPNYGA